MNAKEAAAILGVSPRAVYALAAPQGPIPCYRIGRTIVFDEADVVGFKQSQRVTQVKNQFRASSQSLTLKLKASEPGAESALERAFRKFGVVPRLTPPSAAVPKSKPSDKKKSCAASTPRKRSTGGPAT